MKYLMALAVSIAVGAGAMAQDYNDNVNKRTSGKSRPQQFSRNTSMSPGTTIDRSNDNLPRERFESGSVYYIENPDPNEGLGSGSALPQQLGTSSDREVFTEGKTKVKTEDFTSKTKIKDGEFESSTKVGDKKTEVKVKGIETQLSPSAEAMQESTAGAGTESTGKFNLGKKCALHSTLEGRKGHFKVRKDEDNMKLRVEREKDGEEKILYDSDTEYYRYERNEKGETQSVYGSVSDNEAIQIFENPDGSADVIYEGHFNSLDEARSLQDGLEMEGMQSVCNE
ncbi:MAG: hypothetical protein K2X86_16615 [Cytophagaceae bacterium]|nr:hypothetical protein [Cytophagaceae bacterium]